MFRIGEFAQIAQVSGRQLRFYDQLGLLRPAHTDQQTGYRYYSIRQLPRLNSILALKELGLSLEQIGPLLRNEISPVELRGMLTMKRAQVESSLRDEEARLRHIESRIAQIDRHGGFEDYDVLVKAIEPISYLSLRCACEDMDEATRMIRLVAEEGGRQIRPALRDKLIVVARNDRDDEKLDLEIGFFADAAVERQRPCLRRTRALCRRTAGGRDDGHDRQARHQLGEPYVVWRHR
jgi:DNA-binding transcriptional MerR regulator